MSRTYRKVRSRNKRKNRYQRKQLEFRMKPKGVLPSLWKNDLQSS